MSLNRAFIWTAAEGLADLGLLDGSSAVAIAINNRDEVIGLTRREGVAHWQ